MIYEFYNTKYQSWTPFVLTFAVSISFLQHIFWPYSNTVFFSVDRTKHSPKRDVRFSSLRCKPRIASQRNINCKQLQRHQQSPIALHEHGRNATSSVQLYQRPLRTIRKLRHERTTCQLRHEHGQSRCLPRAAVLGINRLLRTEFPRRGSLSMQHAICDGRRIHKAV